MERPLSLSFHPNPFFAMLACEHTRNQRVKERALILSESVILPRFIPYF